jgi:hypothetical protein
MSINFPEGENRILATNHTETIHVENDIQLVHSPNSNKTNHSTFQVDTGTVLN